MRVSRASAQVSSWHNERVARSSTGRSYIVFDEVAGHGKDAAVMLGVATSLTIARFHRSDTTGSESPRRESGARGWGVRGGLSGRWC